MTLKNLVTQLWNANPSYSCTCLVMLADLCLSRYFIFTQTMTLKNLVNSKIMECKPILFLQLADLCLSQYFIFAQEQVLLWKKHCHAFHQALQRPNKSLGTLFRLIKNFKFFKSNVKYGNRILFSVG